MHKITDGCIFKGKGQLYISHLPGDEQMKELVWETGCGVESIEFSMADSLNRLSDTIESYRKRMKYMETDRLLLHGPFLDLNLSASYASYTKPFFTVIKMPEILEKSSFFACIESKYVV